MTDRRRDEGPRDEVGASALVPAEAVSQCVEDKGPVPVVETAGELAQAGLDECAGEGGGEPQDGLLGGAGGGTGKEVLDPVQRHRRDLLAALLVERFTPYQPPSAADRSRKGAA